MKKVAILIDGGFLSKIFHVKTKKNITADDVIKIASKAIDKDKEEIFRIYYYDAPPFEYKLINPINNYENDYSKSPLFTAISNFQRTLAEKDFVALRLGKLSCHDWKLSKGAIDKIKTGKQLTAFDIVPDFKQKAVDMRVGLDIAWLATRNIVDTVILIAADNDFIPAMKFARKEGIHVAIAKIEQLNSEMRQHSDRVIEVDITQP